MKELGIIKWIISLSRIDRVWVILLIAIAVLWRQDYTSRQEIKTYQQQIIDIKDTCNEKIIRLVRFQVDKVQSLQSIVDSMNAVNIIEILKENKINRRRK